jgi:hypothetical protein
MPSGSVPPLPTEQEGEFVLDEGLEGDDEEVLAFEASRRVANASGGGGRERAAANERSCAVSGVQSSAPPQNSPPPYPDAVIVDGMPSDANRSHMESFLDGCGEIVALKVYRFPDRTLAARVQFSSEACAAKAVERNATDFARPGCTVAVRYAPLDWDGFVNNHPCKAVGAGPSAKGSDAPALRGAAMAASTPVNLSEVLPPPGEMKAAFWDAVASARAAAERFDKRARAAGEDIDKTFHVAEQLDEASKRSWAALAEVDEKYRVRESLDAALVAGRHRAGEVVEGVKQADASLNVSRRLGEVTAKLSQVGTVAVREVDENLRVSERARDAANAALENDQIGPVVKGTVCHLEGVWTNLTGPAGASGAGSARKRKERAPSGVEQAVAPPPPPPEQGVVEDEGRTRP